MSSLSFENLRIDYELKFEACQITDVKAVSKAVQKILQQVDFYAEIERQTGVPWYMTAAIHIKECNGRLNCQLFNGEPWNRTTKLVPIGKGPWKGFVHACLDLFEKYKNFNWTTARVLYECERHNGMAYRSKHPEVNSPYLWSHTSLYKKGLYIKDHVFDPETVSKTPGCAAIIKYIQENSISLVRG